MLCPCRLPANKRKSVPIGAPPMRVPATKTPLKCEYPVIDLHNATEPAPTGWHRQLTMSHTGAHVTRAPIPTTHSPPPFDSHITRAPIPIPYVWLVGSRFIIRVVRVVVTVTTHFAITIVISPPCYSNQTQLGADRSAANESTRNEQRANE